MNVQEETDKESQYIMSKLVDAVELFEVKNVAYGNSFGVSVQKYGLIAALTRMSDKFNRIEALILGAKNGVTDEKLQDTLVDMAMYCMMTLYEIEKQNIKEEIE